MTIQHATKSQPQRRIVGLLAGVGVGALLALNAFLAAAQDSVQDIQERANASRGAADAEATSMKSEAAHYVPGHIRFFSPNQLTWNGLPKPGAYPRPLNDNEIEYYLDKASKGVLTLWYISNGYALNEHGERTSKGDLIELSGDLLTAAITNRKQELEALAQAQVTANAPTRQSAEAADAVAKATDDAAKATTDVVSAGISLAMLAGIAYLIKPDLFDHSSQAADTTSQQTTQNRTQSASYNPPSNTQSDQTQDATQSTTYQDGATDRNKWETWFNGLSSGDYRSGAFYWTSHRSGDQKGSCFNKSSGSYGDFTNGCLSAKKFLDQIDQRRRDNAEYKAGWNSVNPPASSAQNFCSVIGIKPDDTDGGLTIHESSARGARTVSVIPYNGRGITNLDCACNGDATNQRCHVNYNGVAGWVSSQFLFPD